MTVKVANKISFQWNMFKTFCGHNRHNKMLIYTSHHHVIRKTTWRHSGVRSRRRKKIIFHCDCCGGEVFNECKWCGKICERERKKNCVWLSMRALNRHANPSQTTSNILHSHRTAFGWFAATARSLPQVKCRIYLFSLIRYWNSPSITHTESHGRLVYSQTYTHTLAECLV